MELCITISIIRFIETNEMNCFRLFKMQFGIKRGIVETPKMKVILVYASALHAVPSTWKV